MPNAPVASREREAGSATPATTRRSPWLTALVTTLAVVVLLYVGVRLGRITPEPEGETAHWSGGPNYNARRDLRFAAGVAFKEQRYADSLRELDEAKSLSPDGEEDHDTAILRRDVMAALSA